MNGWDALGAEGPLYQSVQRQMLAALEQGEWRPDEAIPSEKRLCDRFGVSVGTLRKAIDALVAEHLLVRRQGLGTFVASHSRPR
ncbi:MAG: GntR family transcriptional regulator, partial [Betaproteobacteria bacterium]